MPPGNQRELHLVSESICDTCIPLGPGSCEEAKLRVLQFIRETEEMVSASNSSQFPLGESFLVAKGIRLRNEDLGLPPLFPPREAFSEQFLRGSDYAIRLAAQSSECRALQLSYCIPLEKQGFTLSLLSDLEDFVVRLPEAGMSHQTAKQSSPDNICSESEKPSRRRVSPCLPIHSRHSRLSTTSVGWGLSDLCTPNIA
ncbi:hypothetical protein P7K49_026441 [Saguinus oedipus]|uniref:Uncharacterized protein n=1 Tax=Saguinus oedipus TaxID=9490 RepID=A0ABQ9UE47_SAGOE|nr:hypothetical protein P7K49_026441 [Saguinus oedipus]